MNEFELIQHCFTNLGSPNPSVLVGVGDDCALLSPPAGQCMALSIDTLVEGVHFPKDIDPKELGYRALAVSLSDLAAAGAEPAAFTLALTVPEADTEWLQRFSTGLAQLANQVNIPLIGGDTTRGPLTISVQVHGWVKQSRMLTRSGAQVGDDIYLSGSVGDASAALRFLEFESPNRAQQQLLKRYYRPSPRLALGQALSKIATAALDVSDGVAADLGHICEHSGVGAELWAEALPISNDLLKCVDYPTALQYALSGGDDYELCFTAMPIQRGPLDHLADDLGVPLTRVGVIVPGDSVRCEDADGNEMVLVNPGYQHFSEKGRP